MKTFHCDHCDQLVFFESTQCVNCKRTLAYVADEGGVVSFDAVGDGVPATSFETADGRRYKLCSNYSQNQICNWAVAANDPNGLCQACRLTRTAPDPTFPNAKILWYKVEVAKRRLLYTLLHLGLPTSTKFEDPTHGLAFDILADEPGVPKVMTGHDEGLITLALAEADDAEREKRRQQMHEPYRTLLGHMRHEVGHYYWDVLIKPDADRLAACRTLFGDDTVDYGQALQKHYSSGPPPQWQEQYVSEYATTHAWEDWAETWAHYLHIVDTLETASDCGIQIQPQREHEPKADYIPDPGHPRRAVQPDDPHLGPTDVRAEQPQPRPGRRRRLPVRAERPGDQKAAVRSRHGGGVGRQKLTRREADCDDVSTARHAAA